MLHKVKIIETISKTEYVEAETKEEAVNVALQLYDNSEVDMEKNIDLVVHLQYIGVDDEETEGKA